VADKPDNVVELSKYSRAVALHSAEEEFNDYVKDDMQLTRNMLHGTVNDIPYAQWANNGNSEHERRLTRRRGRPRSTQEND
jgi:hypothetical protein